MPWNERRAPLSHPTFALSILLLAMAAAACRTSAPAVSESPAAESSAASRTSPDLSGTDAGAPAFSWPVPEGWRAETIPFPLDFAPEVPYRGTEELRFPPGMFKPEAPLYFSYAFVFWLEGEADLSEGTLEESLRRYFVGLTRAVGEGKKRTYELGSITASMESRPDVLRVNGHEARRLSGTVRTFDPFSTGAELVLELDVWVWRCPRSQRDVALFIASPKPDEDPAWKALEEVRASFRCHRH